MKRPILFEDCVLVNNILYFFAEDLNAVCSYEYIPGKLQYLTSIPDEEFICQRLSGNILYYEGKIIIVPMRTKASKVWIYDLKKEQWDYVQIDMGDIKLPYEKIAFAEIVDGQLILVGCYYPGIIIIDLSDNSVTFRKEIFEKSTMLYSLFSCLVCEGLLYIPSPQKNAVYVFDIKKQRGQEIKIGPDNNTYSGIVNVKDNFFLAPFRGNALIKWDGKKDYERVSIPDILINDKEYMFRGVGMYGEKVVVNGLEGKCSFSFVPSSWEKHEILEETYIICKEIDENTFIKQDYQGNVCFFVDGNETVFKIEMEDDEIIRLSKMQGFNLPQIVDENSFFDINLYTKMLS